MRLDQQPAKSPRKAYVLPMPANGYLIIASIRALIRKAFFYLVFANKYNLPKH